MSDLDELYDELSDLHAPQKEASSRTPREERIIAGFEDIEHFFEQHGRLPAHGEDKDIFERLYAVRLEKIRGSEECRTVLDGLDKYSLLGEALSDQNEEYDALDDDKIMEELEGISNSNITTLTHVRSRAEIKAAEEIASRAPCNDFDKFKPLFAALVEDLTSGRRIARQQRKDAGLLKAQIKVGDFFIVNGQTLYIAEIGEKVKASDRSMDARLRVIYSNGTESNILLETLRRAIYKDETSRIISDPSLGSLFSDEIDDSDVETGTIYVLRSNSEHPWIKENREFIHKIGVTSGDVKKRIGNPKVSSTYLMADVEIVATYELSNINPVKLENLLHRFFKSAQLNVEIKDRLGNPIDPREWFLVPLFVIDEAIQRIKDGSIIDCSYHMNEQKIKTVND